MSVHRLAFAAVSLIIAQISLRALATVSIIPVKMSSIAPLTALPALPIWPRASATDLVATVAAAASVLMLWKLSPTPSRSFLMLARLVRALFSFCSQLAIASSLSPYFCRTSSRAFS